MAVPRNAFLNVRKNVDTTPAAISLVSLVDCIYLDSIFIAAFPIVAAKLVFLRQLCYSLI
jgi:hypothetical protein